EAETLTVAELTGQVDDHVDVDRRPDADRALVGDRDDRRAGDGFAGEEVHVRDLRLAALARVGGEEAGGRTASGRQVHGDRVDGGVGDLDHDRAAASGRPGVDESLAVHRGQA